jgi:peptidylprolyl isomerase
MKIAYARGEIPLEEAVKSLILSGQAGGFAREPIIAAEAVRKADELGLETSDEEMQEFSDEFRRLRDLYSAKDTLDFLSLHGLTEDDFSDFCEATILVGKIKEHLASEDRVREYFIRNRSDFDLAKISIMTVKEESLAGEIILQVAEEGRDFHALARKHSLDANTKSLGGFQGFVPRRRFNPEIAAKVFNAAAGEVLGPYPENGLLRLIYVEELIRAELDDRTRELIAERIFDEWAAPFLAGPVSVSLGD